MAFWKLMLATWSLNRYGKVVVEGKREYGSEFRSRLKFDRRFYIPEYWASIHSTWSLEQVNLGTW